MNISVDELKTIITYAFDRGGEHEILYSDINWWGAGYECRRRAINETHQEVLNEIKRWRS